MVIAKILSVLLPTLQCRKLVSMHIDYANRDESGREAAFVQDWARRHHFESHVRVVDEVTRGVTSRSDYEKVSRQIRYGFYKDVLTQGGWRGNGAADGVGVIFGHHIGDIQENVISNIMR
jgi:tRNA(Ile)-lysidine synthase TilS/MesJ